MRVREAWVVARKQLDGHSIPDASIEAEVLLRHVLSMEREDFFAAPERQLESQQKQLADGLVLRRMAGEPLAYIVGRREFYGLDFHVDRHVLIPRQETELLVQAVLEYCEQTARGPVVIADVGAGCGAIAVALACHLPEATVYATDASAQALRVADVNRNRHRVADRVLLRHGDLLGALEAPVDVIVANLPYLTTAEIPGLPSELRREPALALDGGSDGLDLLDRLIRQAPGHVRRGGLIVVEIAPSQLGPVMRIGKEAFPDAQVSYARDLLGLFRAVSIRVPGHGE